MKIEDFSEESLDDIMEIAKSSFKRPRTRDMFLACAGNGAVKFKICRAGGKTAGFCIYSTVGPETELLNIAVLPPLRRRSIAKNMLAYMEKDIKKEDSHNIFLEVRKSNSAAINLYLSFGFAEIAVRKKYYGGEDAIVLRKTI